MAVLVALKTYQSGHGVLGKLSWSAEWSIVDALDEAFYLSFQAVEPTGKRHLLALDVSGSMGASISGSPHLSCREGAAAMAMVAARTEKNWHCVGFTASGRGYGGDPSCLTPIDLSPRQRLDDVVRAMAKLPMGGTDCSLPMLYAAGEGIDVDCFSIYTDNETWHGNIHPYQALQAYRAKSGRSAKLAVVAMTSTPSTIADSRDGGMMDFVGFDSATPTIIADFARGG